ncbi:MAG: hypothetical protein ACOZCL_13725 [Bacillota bacterium]
MKEGLAVAADMQNYSEDRALSYEAMIKMILELLVKYSDKLGL